MCLKKLLICHLVPREEVKADFKRIDTESSTFLRDVIHCDRVCKSHYQEILDTSKSHERDVFKVVLMLSK